MTFLNQDCDCGRIESTKPTSIKKYCIISTEIEWNIWIKLDICTKKINMSNMMVYIAMFSKTNNKILYFFPSLQDANESLFFSHGYSLKLGTFFCFCLTIPLPRYLDPEQSSPLFSLESFPKPNLSIFYKLSGRRPEFLHTLNKSQTWQLCNQSFLNSRKQKNKKPIFISIFLILRDFGLGVGVNCQVIS